MLSSPNGFAEVRDKRRGAVLNGCLDQPHDRRSQRSEPDIRVDMNYGNVPELQAGIKSNQLDLAICPLGVVETGSGFDFTEILPGRNIVASAAVAAFEKPRITADDLLAFPWIAPLPGSPLLADLHAILLSIGISEVSIRYTGGSLLSVLNYLEETDAMTVLPHSVVFASCKSRSVAVLPVKIPQPERSLGILRMTGAPRLARRRETVCPYPDRIQRPRRPDPPP